MTSGETSDVGTPPLHCITGHSFTLEWGQDSGIDGEGKEIGEAERVDKSVELDGDQSHQRKAARLLQGATES